MGALENSSRITPFLWFAENAGEAAEFYIGIFKNSRKLSEIRNPSLPEQPVLTVSFELDGQKFTALNGGPLFQFNEAVSFVIRCDDQADVDYYWERLTAEGGKEGRCGWLKDKFGLSWQVVPAKLAELIKKPEAMQAMLRMNKLEIATLEQAASE